MLIALGIVLVLIVIAVLSVIGVRNGIIRDRNRCKGAWSGIDVQLKHCHDLVPKPRRNGEGLRIARKPGLRGVTAARAQAMAAQGEGQTAQTEQQLTNALVDLRAVAENYPHLHASENFQQLSSKLAEIEAQIQVSRDTYNSDVQAYNTKIQIFPNSIIARRGGFRPREFFAIADAADQVPVEVSFGD
jgi:LemA protein